MVKEQEILVAFGGNLPLEGELPLVFLPRAIKRLDALGVFVQSVSSFYQTPCFPEGAGPDYVNGALVARSVLPATQVLEALHMVEAEFGRARMSRWAGRTLDFDLLAVEGHILPDMLTQRQWVELPLEEQKKRAPEELILPHPRLQDRAFVLVPLKEVAPDWRHPVLGKTIAEFCAALPDKEVSAVVRL
jgi:2-amino-4-hydroxy-6-hydroxymethyldihydropteridine diphosphokinase